MNQTITDSLTHANEQAVSLLAYRCARCNGDAVETERGDLMCSRHPQAQVVSIVVDKYGESLSRLVGED